MRWLSKSPSGAFCGRCGRWMLPQFLDRHTCAMTFFTGMHHPNDADKVPAAFISVNAVYKRKSAFPAKRAVLDCAGFSKIKMHGGYPEPVEDYAAQIRKVRGWLGRRLLAAVSEDYMCEPEMLAKTGLSIEDHQRLTIERYDALLLCDTSGVRIMPVLQGYSPDSYVEHIRQYGKRLVQRMWVGVGSICKRNANYRSIEAVLRAIKKERPDLRLHAFGVKITALASQLVRDLIFSADSMAWSFGARYAGRDGNDPAEAVRYSRRVATQPTQLYLVEIA